MNTLHTECISSFDFDFQSGGADMNGSSSGGGSEWKDSGSGGGAGGLTSNATDTSVVQDQDMMRRRDSEDPSNEDSFLPIANVARIMKRGIPTEQVVHGVPFCT